MNADADRLTMAFLLLLAGVLLWAIVAYWPEHPERIVQPTPTLWVIVVTATPRAVPIGPVLPTKTPPPPLILNDVLPTRTLVPTRTPTVPPTPDWLPTTPTPARSPVQRGDIPQWLT